MRTNAIAKSLAIAAQIAILLSSAGLTRAQSATPQIVQPSASQGSQPDPYAAAFAGLTYSDAQKEAIRKIREDIASRKAVVRKSDKLTDDQKNAMLTGYTRMEYSLIYKELTPEQKKKVSLRMHADDAKQKKQAAPASAR